MTRRHVTRALLLVLFSACAPGPPGAAPLPRAVELRHVLLGLCEDYPEEGRTLDSARRDLDLLASTGVKALRISIGWDGVEPTEDVYDFAFWDAFIDLAVREYGLTLLPYVAYTPEWNSSVGAVDFWRAPPRDVSEFGEIVGLLARRYHGLIRSWELWNEPDNRDYWIGDAEQYVDMLQVGAAAVREVDPELQVVFGGLAGGLEFLSETFDLGAGAHVDAVNLHAYYETWNPQPIETITEYLAGAEQIVRRHGEGDELWMAEVGYSNYRRGATVSAATAARFDYEHTLRYQAAVLAKTIALAYAGPPISVFAWYELKDPPATDEVIGDVNNRHLGIAFSDRRPKPALSALSFMNSSFADGFVSVSEQLQVERATGSGEDGPAPEVRGFLSGRGTLMIFAWLPTPKAAPESDASLGTAHDSRYVRLKLTAPFATRGPVRYYDAEGSFAETSRVDRGARHDAEDTVLSLGLKGGEVLIAELPLTNP